MSSVSGRVRRPSTRRPQVFRMAPVRRGGKAKLDAIMDENRDGKILLSNVGTDVDLNAIYEKFGEFGLVTKALIHYNNKKTRIGTAEIWMSTGKEANKAKYKLNATDIFNDGRIIRIEKHKLTTAFSTFWKNVYEYLSQMNTKILTEANGN